MTPKIDENLVRRLLAAQFPAWAALPIRAARPQGWDNRTFRLGDELAARLPSAARYAVQVEKEQTWLPRLAPRLPLPIPVPVAEGAPGEGYPWPWSIFRWMDGETAQTARTDDMPRFARDLAGFLRALQGIDASEGPPAGAHSFWRGGPLATYDRETREAIETLGARVDGIAAADVWDAALGSAWGGRPVWVHGDVAAGNLLVDSGGRLGAVIDFGCLAVGDPACDLVIAWTLLDGEARETFRDAAGLDDATWARARGWALWKALILLASPRPHLDRADSQRIIDAVIAEHRAGD